MSNLPQTIAGEDGYETPPFVALLVPNRFISANVRRGSIIFFDGNDYAANEADKLTAGHIEKLRARGDSIIEDPGVQVPGIVTEVELKARADSLDARTAAAYAAGDLKTYWSIEESARMARSAYNDFLARKAAA